MAPKGRFGLGLGTATPIGPSPHADHTCDKCSEPLTEIDFYRERLNGCLSCNVWITTAGCPARNPPGRHRGAKRDQARG
jgi:hypothetical protein